MQPYWRTWIQICSVYHRDTNEKQPYPTYVQHTPSEECHGTGYMSFLDAYHVNIHILPLQMSIFELTNNIEMCENLMLCDHMYVCI